MDGCGVASAAKAPSALAPHWVVSRRTSSTYLPVFVWMVIMLFGTLARFLLCAILTSCLRPGVPSFPGRLVEGQAQDPERGPWAVCPLANCRTRLIAVVGSIGYP